MTFFSPTCVTLHRRALVSNECDMLLYFGCTGSPPQHPVDERGCRHSAGYIVVPGYGTEPVRNDRHDHLCDGTGGGTGGGGITIGGREGCG